MNIKLVVHTLIRGRGTNFLLSTVALRTSLSVKPALRTSSHRFHLFHEWSHQLPLHARLLRSADRKDSRDLLPSEISTPCTSHHTLRLCTVIRLREPWLGDYFGALAIDGPVNTCGFSPFILSVHTDMHLFYNHLDVSKRVHGLWYNSNGLAAIS